MTVYLDALKEYPNKPFGYLRWAHMTADSREELHTFARKIGLKPEWFQDRPRLWHYDVTPSKHTLALANGAKLVTWREMAAITLARCEESTTS